MSEYTEGRVKYLINNFEEIKSTVEIPGEDLQIEIIDIERVIESKEVLTDDEKAFIHLWISGLDYKKLMNLLKRDKNHVYRTRDKIVSKITTYLNVGYVSNKKKNTILEDIQDFYNRGGR